ncbi:hypothetical protein U9M48_044589 [Paspalum notatum var. saurae]|uniref:Uncharacterized protein n=1 Tax=Paspalum notatum var. saurae TaxID=547442 RepID=A0AAQ3XGW3_PASNO
MSRRLWKTMTSRMMFARSYVLCNLLVSYGDCKIFSAKKLSYGSLFWIACFSAPPQNWVPPVLSKLWHLLFCLKASIKSAMDCFCSEVLVFLIHPHFYVQCFPDSTLFDIKS